MFIYSFILGLWVLGLPAVLGPPADLGILGFGESGASCGFLFLASGAAGVLRDFGLWDL